MSHQKTKRQRTHPSPRPRILLQPIVEAHSRDLTPDECVVLGKQLVHCGSKFCLKLAELDGGQRLDTEQPPGHISNLSYSDKSRSILTHTNTWIWGSSETTQIHPERGF